MKKKQDYKQLVHIFGLARDQFNQRSGRKECIRRRVEGLQDSASWYQKVIKTSSQSSMDVEPPYKAYFFFKSQDIQDDKTMKV